MIVAFIIRQLCLVHITKHIHMTCKDYKNYSLFAPDLLNVFKYCHNIPDPSGSFFYFTGTTNASHRCDLHRLPHKRLAVVESVEQDLPCSHRNLYRMDALGI